MTAVIAVSMSAHGAACNIYMNSNQQTIDGFGFSSAWSGQLSDAQFNALMGTGSGQCGLSLLRIRIDPNSTLNNGTWVNSAWADETANAAKALARGYKVLGSPWSPPASMKDNNILTNGGHLLPAQYGNYAKYLHDAANSIGLDYVSLQNEPDWAPAYESGTWTSAQFHDFCVSNAAAIGKPVVMPEAVNFNDSLSDPTLNDPAAVTNITIVAGHFYGGGNSVHQNALNHGKHVWETEHYYNNTNGNTDINTCMTIAKEVSDAMNNQFSAYFWWWTPQGDPATLLNGSTPLRNAITIGHFARWVRPGSVRVTADYNPSSGVYVTAYKVNNGTVIVALNTGASSVSQQFNVLSGNATMFEGFQSVSNQYNMADIGSFSALGGSFTATLPRQSVTTFTQTGFFVAGLTGTNMTWSVPAPITTADATLTPPPGHGLAGAATFGRTAYTVTLTNGMQFNFTSDGSVATATGLGPVIGCFTGDTSNANFNAVLNAFKGDGGPKTITLNNLTVGTRYVVQFFGLDDRNNGTPPTSERQAYLQDTNLPGDVSQTWHMGDNVYVTGTFTASGPTKTFLEQHPGNDSGGDVNKGNANALVLWLAPTTPASNPAPADGASNVAFNAFLSWTPGSNAVTHAVYLGTSSNAVAQATSSSPQFQGLLTTTNFYPALNGSSAYYWRVDELNGTNTSAGAVWSFVTAPLPALAHRYSFGETGGASTADSVGGPAWAGTLPNGGALSGLLMLTSNSQQYVRLPAGIVSTLSNFTVMAWVNLASTGNWARLFDFGNSTSVYMYLAPQNGTTLTLRYAITTGGNAGEQPITNSATLTLGVWHQVAVTLNGSTGILYLDGAPVGTNSAMTLAPSGLGITTNNYIGKSQWVDPYLNGSLEEFRIYSVGLSPAEVAATYALGSGQLLSTNNPVLAVTTLPASVTLSWPLEAAGFTVQSRTNLILGDWGNVTSPAPQIIGNLWQVTLPSSGDTPSTYYRLLK